MHSLACAVKWRVFKARRQEVRTIEFYEKEVSTIEFNEPSSSHRPPSLINFLKVPVHLYIELGRGVRGRGHWPKALLSKSGYGSQEGSFHAGEAWLKHNVLKR